MKRLKIFISWMILCMLLFSGCGEQGEEEKTAQEDYYILRSENVEYAVPKEKTDAWELLGMQFYQGEVISLWGEQSAEDEKMTVYISYEDGTGKILLEQVEAIHSHEWYLAANGDFYLLADEYVVKVKSSGEEDFRVKLSGGTAWDICQLADGAVFLLVRMEDDSVKLAKLDEQSGKIRAVGGVKLSENTAQYISAGDGGLLLADNEGVWKVNLQDGSRENVVFFRGTDYAIDYTITDFRATEDGTLELLGKGMWRSVRFENVAETRTIIMVRSSQFQSYMQGYADQFNQFQDSYYVVLDERNENTDLADFLNQTNVELGTGGGADIIFENALNNAEGFLAKGAFVDLRPFLEQDGLEEEDFFPAAFDYWEVGDAIYSANMLARTKGIWMSKELIGENASPDIQTLVNVLLNYQGNAVFKFAWDAEAVLDYFLAGSEDLWGMLDWEKGTCNFSGALFAQMLEAAKRFEWDEKKDLPALTEYRMESFYSFESEEDLAAEEKIYVGYIYEDGCYPAINQTGVMAINANSDENHRQGAWKFISFLLGEELQSTLSLTTYPVNKEAFETIAGRELQEGSISNIIENGEVVGRNYKAGIEDYKKLGYDVEAYRAIHDLDETVIAEIREVLERSRPLPTRADAIKAIIYEEAAEYFAETKGIQEVIAVIENRVQLYLDENK